MRYERHKKARSVAAPVFLTLATFLLLLRFLEVVEKGIDIVMLLDQFEGEISKPTYHNNCSRVD